jgi:cell division protein ZapA
MAALGMAADYLGSRSAEGPFASMSVSDMRQKINAMHAALDTALAPQERLF